LRRSVEISCRHGRLAGEGNGQVWRIPVSPIPASVRRFVLSSIPSVPYLEAILLLRGDPAFLWDAKDTAQRLYLRPQATRELLDQLAEAGIAVADPCTEGCFRYQPASPDLGILLDQLAAAYSGDLVGITELIHSRIDKRAQHFADAFRWRKEP
jgi:hypothetical protein